MWGGGGDKLKVNGDEGRVWRVGAVREAVGARIVF